MIPLRVLSMFTGIGGLDLGLQQAGMRIAGQVEIDPWCRSVLDRHWPEVPKHDDARTAADWWARSGGGGVDVVAGGPPCQPFSLSGARRGISDERWLWPAMAATVRALRPAYVIVENVSALIRHGSGRAFGWILGDLAELGFNAEWGVLSACAMGAPHPRERLFLVAYPDSCHGQPRVGAGQGFSLPGFPRGVRESASGRAAARAWRDRVDGAVATASSDDRNSDGIATRMVESGGNAVVPQVAEIVGRYVMAIHQSRSAAVDASSVACPSSSM